MAITSAICNSFKKECLDGVHNAADTYMIALYTSSATLDKSTTEYTVDDEASGAGYTAGGQTLVGYTTALDGDVAYIDWTSDPSWTSATITARGCLLYNATQGNRAVAVFDFGADVSSSSGTFTITLPTPSAATALVRLS